MSKLRLIFVIIIGFIGLLLFSVLIETNNSEKDTSVDIDLTSLNNNLAYSQVKQMNNFKDDYEGKSIKIYSYVYNEDDNYYFEIKDQMGCCNIKLDIDRNCNNLFIDKTNRKVRVIGIFKNGVITDCKLV